MKPRHRIPGVVGAVVAFAAAVVFAGTTDGGHHEGIPGASLSVADTLSKARAALGGTARIGSIRTITLIGHWHVLTSLGREISVDTLEFTLTPPSKSLRTMIRTMPPTDEASGFDGDLLITRNHSRDPSMTAVVRPQSEEQRAWSLQFRREEAMRVLLGCCLTDRTPVPIRFDSAGRVTSPDGEAIALAVSGPGGFSATLYLNPATHRPFLMEYGCLSGLRAPQPRAGDSALPVVQAPSSSPWLRIPCGVHLSDFRNVNGLSIPHVWRHTQNDRPAWEWRFDKVRVVFAR